MNLPADRREFIITVTRIMGILGSWPVFAATNPSRNPSLLFNEDIKEMQQLGQRYLATLKPPPTYKQLSQSMQQLFPPKKKLSDALSEGIATDCDQGNLIWLDDWMFTRSELEICAWLFLHP